jgi:hypothetical protein
MIVVDQARFVKARITDRRTLEQIADELMQRQ